MNSKPLKDILDECISMAKTTLPTVAEKGKLYKWKGNISSFVSGKLEFRYLPSFGPVLFDSTSSISCLIIDPVRNVRKLIKLCNHELLLNNPQFVVEVFVLDSKEHSLVHLLLDASKLCKQDDADTRIEIENSVSLSASAASWNQTIIPLKVSSTIQTPKSDIICFVLVILVTEEKDKDELVWLVLKDVDVVWKDLLIPYRMFNINVPSKLPTDYFCRRGSSMYNFFDPKWDVSFSQMLHHKDLMKTCAVINFPKNSKINTLDHRCEIGEQVERWFHISDPRLKSTNFASIYGIIKEIQYIKAWKTYSCSWCRKVDNVFEETIRDNNNRDEETMDEDASDEFENEWCTPETIVSECSANADIDYFPQVRFNNSENEKIGGFGIRGGKLTVQITLQKNYYSDRVAYVFLKRWKASQYPAGLVPGVTVCFTDVNVKRTKKKYFYFISTPLTRIIHLEATGLKMDVIPEKWGNFGFPFSRSGSAKYWGVLDLDLLTKVSICARCNLCNKEFLQYRCSNVYCSNNQLEMNPKYTVKAVARLFVRGFLGHESNSLYLTNENVQKYLQIPDRIWQKLYYLSANSELIYLCSDTETDEEDCDIANIYFRRYCKLFRPRPRFHVHCKAFKDNENSFFCLDLREINESRVNSLRFAIEKQSK